MAQAGSVAVPKRLPLVIEPENRNDSTAKDARLINCFMESHRTAEGQTEYWIYKRPGLDEFQRPPAANAAGRGVFNWRGAIYSVFGATLYQDGVAIAGTVDATGGVYRFDSCLGATPRLVLGNGVEAYRYDSGGGLVLINDADFPVTFQKGWAYLDATLYVLKANAHVQGSDPNDPSAWDPLNDILAQIEPDQGVALSKQLVYIVAFKEWSIEVFYDAGNTTGSPLGAVQGAKVSYGCGSQDSVQNINGVLYFITVSRTAGIQIGQIDQLKFDVISTKAIERLIQTADLTTIFSWQLALEGHSWYIVTFKTNNLTLAYDMKEKLWWQWTDESGNYCKIVDSTYDTGGVAILQHETNGRLYHASSSYTSDDGAAIQVDLYTPNFDAGVQSRRKALHRMYFIADQDAGNELLVRCNDHDYKANKWTNFRRVNLGLARPVLDACGSFTKRAHNIRHKQDKRLRLKAVELQLDIGTG